jgi:pimeloyl-ACP methyl ester carboxylesterase
MPRVILSLLAFILGLACLGALYQAIGNWRDARRFPQRGTSVQVGQVKLNLNCSGTGSPRVILESGAGMSSIGWIMIQPEIAKFTRVCSYDRAGYGWSEPGLEPRTSIQIAKELKLLLDAAGEKGPYILVGPSFGGLIVRVFAGLYPTEAAGIVLVDAMHEDQQNRVQKIREAAGMAPPNIKPIRKYRLTQIFAPLIAILGIERLQRAINPKPQAYVSKAFTEEFHYIEQQPKFRDTTMSEMKVIRDSGTQAHAAGNLGDVPLIVLTGGKMSFTLEPGLTKVVEDQLRNAWINVLQGEEAHLSTRGKQIVLWDSGHAVQFERPDAVISAIQEVWFAARANQRSTR